MFFTPPDAVHPRFRAHAPQQSRHASPTLARCVANIVHGGPIETTLCQHHELADTRVVVLGGGAIIHQVTAQFTAVYCIAGNNDKYKPQSI